MSTLQLRERKKYIIIQQLIFTNRTEANSSSNYTDGDYVGSADKTIDNNFNQIYSNCMHTAAGEEEAWLHIDLGNIYNLKSVKIWYRNDRNTDRLKGFRVLTTHSANTSLDNSDLCYEDPGNATLKTVLEVDCTKTARYVTIYKKDENEAILEICEVEIYGCQHRRYGEDCLPCDTCRIDCDITGWCYGLGCINNTGYHGPYCKECPPGKYGSDCKETCGHCKKNESCHHVTGSCPGLCEPGFEGVKCLTQCSFGKYGDDCNETCGHCASNQTCYHTNGSCPGSCEAGYEGENCLTACTSRRYDKDCKKECGHCKDNEQCDRISGFCPNKCEPGFDDRKCIKACSSGTYGEDCKEKCGNCANNDSCHHINGSCPGSCEAGYQGKECLTKCQRGFYGNKCTFPCGHCSGNKPCNHVNGSCPGGHCEPGWKHFNQKCDQECDNGTFGWYCASNCSGHCALGLPCNKVNGSCPVGCEDGWINSYCNETCSPRRYGKNCQEKCGHCINMEICHHINGSCFGKCKPGYDGEKCLAKQLVQPKYTRAASSSVYNRYVGYPNKAVDGDFRQNHYTYCMHTASGQREAWLRIDLRKIYNIHSVKFWYRNDSEIKGHNTRRIQGFNIRLSNTSLTLPQNTCYQDDGKTTLPPIIEKECKGVAQYVWIYTNKTYVDGAFLEICEVKIFGCSYQDRHGYCVTCDQCKNDCNVNGECDEQGCKMDGFFHPWCKECISGRYGKDCNSSCGHCANNATCNNITGSCPNKKCAPGWKYTTNWKCNQDCIDGTFGENCSRRCSSYCSKGTYCSKSDGRCPSGCIAGWDGFNCSQQCTHGYYGEKCKQECGKCRDRKPCDHINGSCHGLCEPGYEGDKCETNCQGGFYGRNCNYSCGHCSNNENCNHVEGFCPSGLCAPGWNITSDKKCNQKCEMGFYGINCTQHCGHCTKNATCDHINGSCPNGYCEPGWEHTPEKRCDRECDNGTFGLYCKHNCSGHCAGGLYCSKEDGYCPRGCNDGWINSYCNETCNDYFYGKNCSNQCGNCAKPSICDHVNGSCPNGYCEKGWKNTPDKRCKAECDNGTFGNHCMEKCSGHCTGGLPCKKDDGICIGGCADGWRNDKCNEKCPTGSYGKECDEICGNCGGNDTCNHIHGSCPNLCAPGFQTEKCDTECDNGTFGLRCNFTCSKGCFSLCNKINGTCDLCHDGFIGEFCNITVAESQVQDLTPTVAGVASFLVIFVIAVIVLVIVLARKSRKKKADEIELPDRKETPKSDLLKCKPEDKENKTENGGPMEENAEIEYIVTDNDQKKTLIKIADLGNIIKIFSMEENKKFTEEFKGIPYGEQQHIPCSVAKLQQNMPKNRYKTTFPYDHSRVVLNVSPDNDYINANYIKDVEGKRRYIATQGPRKNTVQDFWAMIWQENIRVIVMVTKLTEGSTIKCEQYWPGQGEQMTSGQFGLQLMSQKDYANYTQRDINITNKKTKAVKTVNQVQFTSWPDHGTPSPIELLVFYRHVMRFTRMYPECPLVVHCSAGIGRTGTFIALDALYKHGQKEGKIDIVEYVKIMREDRMNMIQNAGQYVFLYKALYEIFKTNGRLVNKEEFIKEVTSQLMSNKAANASQFKKEFNELLSIKPVLDENDTKDGRQNIDLNMTKTVLPADSIRVLLTSYAGGRGNYYNAVPISSYTLRDGLIAAQYPVEGAAVDLVRLLIDQECTILVSINQLSDIASSAEWMTTSAEKSVISPYKTMLGTGRSLSNKLKMTVLKMKHDKDAEWHTVKVLEILNWKINEKLPAEDDVLIELMNKVQEIIKDPDTKIIVLSRDGATGCGIFCAVYNAIQQLQQDNEVDMFTIVRQLQMRRPEMISSMSEYQCCCQVVANFFSAHKDDIYENAQGRQEVTKQEENIYANTSS